MPTLSTTDWIDHFRANARNQPEYPWSVGADAPSEVLDKILPSLRAWQLGETSDGTWLVSVAEEHGARIGDPDFAECMTLFIKEEQRHGELLGRYLDLAGVERKRRDWGDTAFRFIRHLVRRIEVWVTPVVMVETHALVYYAAIRDATESRLLSAICEQLLRDEVVHIRFQCERLAALHRGRSRIGMALTKLVHRALFAGMTVAIGLGHRRALEAGDCGFGRFWRKSWEKMRFAWSRMVPAENRAAVVPYSILRS